MKVSDKDKIKRGLECCAAVGSETSCSDCSYVYRCRDLCKDALDLIIEQEKELEIIYRQGSAQPKLVDIRSMRNEKHIY